MATKFPKASDKLPPALATETVVPPPPKMITTSISISPIMQKRMRRVALRRAEAMGGRASVSSFIQELIKEKIGEWEAAWPGRKQKPLDK